MAVLTKRIDDMSKGKSENRKKEKEKSKKGLTADSFNWDDESISSDDERSTKIREVMALQRMSLQLERLMQDQANRVNLENESLKDEIIDLKKVIEKWTCSKVTLDQLLSKQVPGNIVKALSGKGKKKEKISSKEEPLPPLPKLIGAAPSGTLESLISLSDLTLNMVDLTLDTPVPKKTRTSVKVSPAYVIKKKTKKSYVVPKPCSDKKAVSSTKQLLLTLMEKPKCFTCGSTNHLTKEHLEHADVKKTLSKLKALSPLKPSPKKAPMIPKPFKKCKYYRFNDHHSDHYEFYLGCKVCGSIH
nr:hypothetical protein [Tanacetum cinerariifolium]